MKIDRNFRSSERDESGKKKIQPVEKEKSGSLKKTIYKELEDDDDIVDFSHTQKDSILNYFDDGEDDEWDQDGEDEDWDEEEEDDDSEETDDDEEDIK